MPISPETLKQLRETHGEVHVLRAGRDEKAVEVAIRCPTRGEYRRFKDHGRDEKRRSTALEELFLACLLEPDADAFQAILNKRPALADIFGAKVLELAGAEEDAELVKS